MFAELVCKAFSHKWSSWEYDRENSCKQYRRCRRCNREDARSEKHIWSKWEYVTDDSCEQHRHCSRCTQEDVRSGEHVWSMWEYVADDSCKQKSCCERCHTVGKRIANHDWGGYISKDISYFGTGELFSHTRDCKRCGESETKYDECTHPNQERSQICTICGAQLDGLMNC